MQRPDNKCQTWPFLNLNLSTFSRFKFSCHHIAATARMLSLNLVTVITNFLFFFSFFAMKFLRFHFFFLYFCNEVPLILWFPADSWHFHLVNSILSGCCIRDLYPASVVLSISRSCQTFAFRHSLFCIIVFLILHSIFCCVALLPALTYSTFKEKGGKVSRDQKRRGIWAPEQVKMADLVSLEFHGKTLGLTPSNLSKTMIAHFFNVHEEGLHLRVVHNGKIENIWPLSNGKFLVPLGTTNAHVIAFNTSENSEDFVQG